MIALVSGATQTQARYAHTGIFGILLTPRNGNRVGAVLGSGLRWAADNDCFQGLDEARYLRMLAKLDSDEVRASPPLFVTVPDRVGDAKATGQLWDDWLCEVAGRGLPAAYVAQDGAESLSLPWDQMDALFVGGSTDWKESSAAMSLAEAASSRRKWVHVGRVNTSRRLRKLLDWGCVDSIDGRCLSAWPDTYFPWFLAQVRGHGRQSVIQFKEEAPRR
jgi:hypothetical protein